MTFELLESLFHRALAGTFVKHKLVLTAIVLFVCGLFVIFFHGLALSAGPWIKTSLGLFPFFLCSGLILALGIILVRSYQNQELRLQNGWQMVVGFSYLAIPVMGAYLAIWLVLGALYLLEQIPHLGAFLGAVLAFIPFMLILGTLVLAVSIGLLFFFATPALAFGQTGGVRLLSDIGRRCRASLFQSGLLLFIAFLPLLVVLALLWPAAHLTFAMLGESSSSAEVIGTWFFVMIPFVALLTPGVVFFFNFAAESYALQNGEEGA